MDDSSHLFPSRSELSVKSLFASTEEERLLARLLLSQTVEGKDEEHPWQTLERLYPAGSDREHDWENTPAGKAILELCQTQPNEDDPSDYPVEYSDSEYFEQLLEKPAPPPSAPAAADKDMEDLASRTSLSNTIKSHGSEGAPVTKPLVKVNPGERMEIQWEKFDSSNPIY